MKTRFVHLSWALLLVTMIASPGAAHADSIFTVTLNTTPLVGSAFGPFAVAFQLVDGSGLSDNNNTATIGNFTFGGGSADGCPVNCVTTGDASGDMTGTVVLKDSSFFNSFAERFSVGTILSFQVDLTTNLDAGGTPDSFAFSLLDNTGTPLSTSDPLGADTLLSVFIDSADPAVLTYGSPVFTLGAPVLGAPSASVPEPGTLLLIGTGLVGVVGMARRRPKRAR